MPAAIGRAREEHFSKEAKERQREAGENFGKGQESKLPANSPEAMGKESRNQAAEARSAPRAQATSKCAPECTFRNSGSYRAQAGNFRVGTRLNVFFAIARAAVSASPHKVSHCDTFAVGSYRARCYFRYEINSGQLAVHTLVNGQPLQGHFAASA